MDDSEATEAAEALFDALSEAAKNQRSPLEESVTEKDRIEDELYVVKAFEAAVAGGRSHVDEVKAKRPRKE